MPKESNFGTHLTLDLKECNQDKLKQLGLSDNESNVFSVLLHNNPAGATLLSKKCSMSRSSVYTILNSLIGMGLVGTTFKNEVKQFIVEDIEAFEDITDIVRRGVDALADVKRLGLNGLTGWGGLINCHSSPPGWEPGPQKLPLSQHRI